jgi:hypothetical protein
VALARDLAIPTGRRRRRAGRPICSRWIWAVQRPAALNLEIVTGLLAVYPARVLPSRLAVAIHAGHSKPFHVVEPYPTREALLAPRRLCPWEPCRSSLKVLRRTCTGQRARPPRRGNSSQQAGCAARSTPAGTPRCRRRGCRRLGLSRSPAAPPPLPRACVPVQLCGARAVPYGTRSCHR